MPDRLVMLTLRVPADVMDRLTATARRLNLRRSDLVRLALARALADIEADPEGVRTAP